jgi:hypothetical protein
MLINAIPPSPLSYLLKMLGLFRKVFFSQLIAQGMLVILGGSDTIAKLIPRLRGLYEMQTEFLHTCMVACNGHFVFPFGKPACVGLNVVVLAYGGKVNKFFDAIEMYVTSVMEGVGIYSLRILLIEGNAKISFPDRALWVRTAFKAALVGFVVPRPLTAICRSNLDPYCEAR